MVFSRHVSGRLAAYCDGQLPITEARAVDAHLSSCARCRAERDEIQVTAGLIRQLRIVSAPASLWAGIEAELDARPAPRPRLFWRPALAALATLAVIATGVWLAREPVSRPWEVQQPGSVAASRRAVGEWVETGRAARARITVGTIGTVDVEPDTRVRLGSITPDEYRLTLARGTISAQIAAPPRLFFVETPSSTVVDLGCAYTVQVDEAGTGDLRVTEGWASLEWKGRESLVPAGAHCQIRSGVGPGTPYFEDATPALRQALADFDFGDGGSAALATVLEESRVRDTLTLWHLLSRVPAADREHVYERMSALTPVPPGVSRQQALALDAATLKRWREELAWTW